MKTIVVAGVLLLAVASIASAVEVILKDGTPLVGEVVGRDSVALTLDIPLVPGDGVRMGGSVRRPVKWTEIESIDDLTITEWLRSEAGRTGEPEPETDTDAGLLSRFQTWLGGREGMDVGLAIGALALLVLVPALLLWKVGRWMGLRELEGVQALGGALLGLGAGWAAVKVWPGWFAGVPWAAVGAITVLVFVILRPTLGRGLVLAALHVAVLVAVMAGVLRLSRLIP